MKYSRLIRLHQYGVKLRHIRLSNTEVDGLWDR
jgi:hypothetical protein